MADEETFDIYGDESLILPKEETPAASTYTSEDDQREIARDHDFHCPSVYIQFLDAHAAAHAAEILSHVVEGGIQWQTRLLPPTSIPFRGTGQRPHHGHLHGQYKSNAGGMHNVPYGNYNMSYNMGNMNPMMGGYGDMMGGAPGMGNPRMHNMNYNQYNQGMKRQGNFDGNYQRSQRVDPFLNMLRPTLFRNFQTATKSLRLVYGTNGLRLSPPLVRKYHEKVIDHYERPRNMGSLPKNDPDVGTGLVGAPACGDVMKLQIKVNDDGKIVDVKFKTFGCGSAIASSSFVTERVRGLHLDEASEIKNTEIAKELCLPPVKLHCSMLAEDAIKSAIKDYRRKRKSHTTSTTATTNPSA
ncbi:iron-binding protein [Dispira simplex]|nr:iron-binding protein [Dispira simplex]